jgi:hypothetical protein
MNYPISLFVSFYLFLNVRKMDENRLRGVTKLPSLAEMWRYLCVSQGIFLKLAQFCLRFLSFISLHPWANMSEHGKTKKTLWSGILCHSSTIREVCICHLWTQTEIVSFFKGKSSLEKLFLLFCNLTYFSCLFPKSISYFGIISK